jgi:hypothetical protein
VNYLAVALIAYFAAGLIVASALFAFDEHACTGDKLTGFVSAVLLWPLVVLIWIGCRVGLLE